MAEGVSQPSLCEENKAENPTPFINQMPSSTMFGNDYSNEINYNWGEVTDEFVQACDHLQLGELLHDSNFGLFEAMSAIEMMDPKMDAGMMCNQAKRKVLNLEQAIEAGVVKIKDFEFAEIIGIIDDTFACLVTWLEGHSLAQTVFTNLYMHNPFALDDIVLKSFCIGMLKTVDHIKDRVSRASVCEEEDFQPMLYGFKTAGDVSESRVVGMLREAEDELNRTIKNTRSRAGEERDAATEQEHHLAGAVHARIRFFRLLYSTLIAFQREKCTGVDEARKFLKQMADVMPLIKSTVKFGVKPEEREESQHDYPTILGFEPLVNQRLLPPTFPRYTKIRAREETMDYLLELTERMKVVCSVTELNGLHQVLEFFHEFSKPSPCVLSRTLLQLTFLPQNRRVFGAQTMVDFMRESVRNYISPPVLQLRSPITNNAQAKEYVDAFLTHAVRPMCTLFQITGHNRARQRDKWGHLLEELATLQDEADKVDAYLHSLLAKIEPGRQHLACFGTWVLYHTLQVMIHYTLAGFELELYAAHEYHYVFWYLYECLYSWLISTLSRANSFLIEQEQITEQQQKGRTSKKKQKKRKGRPHDREITISQAMQSLCGGYYKAVIGLSLDEKLPMPKFDFDQEEVRYGHRFAPFGCLVTPPAIQYQQYKEMTDLSRYDPTPQPEDLYSNAYKCFQQARVMFEKVSNPCEELQALTKIAHRNSVVMNILCVGHKKDTKPVFDFTSHRVFPTIKIT